MSTTTVNLGYVPKNRGEYSSTASYYKDNIVQYNGSSYICNPPNYDPDTAPTASVTGVAPYDSDPATPNTGWAVFSNDSSGVGEGVYNVSVDHTTDNQPKVYASLLAALNDIPAAKQKGGMSIKFIQGTVQNSDNKYVQYRLMSDTFSTTKSNWQGVDTNVTHNSKNLIESGAVDIALNPLKFLTNDIVSLCYIGNRYIKSDGSFGILQAQTPVYFISPYIRINQGDLLRFKSTNLGESGYAYAIYDLSKTVIGTAVGQTSFNDIISIDNANAYYIVFGINTNGTQSLKTKLNHNLDIQLNGVSKGSYNGETDKTINIEIDVPYEEIAAANTDCTYFKYTENLASYPKVFSINILDMEVYAKSKYIDANGNLQTLANCNVYRFLVPDGVRMISAIRGTGLGVYGCIENEDGTFDSIRTRTNSITNDYLPTILSIKKIKYVYCNYRANDNAGISSLEYVYSLKPFFIDEKSIICNLDDVLYVKKAVNSSTGGISNYDGYSVVRIEIQKDKKYIITNSFSNNVGAFYDGSGNYVGEVGTSISRTPIGAMYALLNVKANTIVKCLYNSNRIKEYATNVNKPFSFNGKSAIFFGDSICAGYASDVGSDITDNWVKMFSDKLGLTYNNRGADSFLIANDGTHASIATRILNTSITEDFIFVAGGTNDAYWNIPIGKITDTELSTFFGALNSIANYFDANYPTKEIIFVMPIGRTSGFSSTTLLTSLSEYRRAIYTVCSLHNYSVVNGEDFGFPGVSSICSDGLHPTTIGYKLYTKCMLNALVG